MPILAQTHTRCSAWAAASAAIASFVLMLGLMVGAPASAQGAAAPSQQARDGLKAGETAYIARDYVAARGHFKRACADGSAGGCFVLGVMMGEGLGGAANLASARACFAGLVRAAQSRAATILGYCLRRAGAELPIQLGHECCLKGPARAGE